LKISEKIYEKEDQFLKLRLEFAAISFLKLIMLQLTVGDGAANKDG
jgi:hypothetical protein